MTRDRTLCIVCGGHAVSIDEFCWVTDPVRPLSLCADHQRYGERKFKPKEHTG